MARSSVIAAATAIWKQPAAALAPQGMLPGGEVRRAWLWWLAGCHAERENELALLLAGIVNEPEGTIYV